MLVAIAIPVFTSQLEKSREATDASNIRAAYAEIAAAALTDPDTAQQATIQKKQTQSDWQSADSLKDIAGVTITDIKSTEDTVVAYRDRGGGSGGASERNGFESGIREDLRGAEGTAAGQGR